MQIAHANWNYLLSEKVAKKLVNSDFKNNRIEDPTTISEKQQKKVKKFCKEYFDKAVVKHREYEKKKAERKAKETDSKAEDAQNGESKTLGTHQSEKDDESDNEALDVKMSDDEAEKEENKSSPMDVEESGASLKRKREELEDDNGPIEECDSPSKRHRSSTPPPPPPPPMSPGSERRNLGENTTPNQHAGDDTIVKQEYEGSTPGDGQTWDTPPRALPPPPLAQQNGEVVVKPVPSTGPGELQGQTDTSHFASHPAEGKLQPSQIGIEGKV